MTKDEKIEMLADMLELEPEDLSEDKALEDIEEWDSLNALNFIVLVSDNFGKTLTADVVNGFKTVKDVLDVME